MKGKANGGELKAAASVIRKHSRELQEAIVEAIVSLVYAKGAAFQNGLTEEVARIDSVLVELKTIPDKLRFLGTWSAGNLEGLAEVVEKVSQKVTK